MSVEILHRDTKAVLYTSATASTIAEAVLEARTHGADLHGADLHGAYLHGAYLHGADLQRAYLHGADLQGADLQGADLQGADLHGADLHGAKGLLPGGLVPLQIGGSRHWLIVREPGYITIGCHHQSLAWWREHYKATGRTDGYSEAEVAEYAAHIEHCAQWMQAHGVDREPAAPPTEAPTASPEVSL